MREEKKSHTLLYAVVLTKAMTNIVPPSPVLSKRPIILLHGLDLWVLVSIFFLFHCRSHKGFFFPNVHPSMSISLKLQNVLVTCALPGYLPPLFLLMKHTMRRTKMRRAMAHISPINQPWVAMSTCRLGTAGHTHRKRKGEKDGDNQSKSQSRLLKKGGICFLHAAQH